MTKRTDTRLQSIPADTAAQIVRLYRAGRTVTQIQRLVGRPPHLIRAVLAQAGPR